MNEFEKLPFKTFSSTNTQFNNEESLEDKWFQDSDMTEEERKKRRKWLRDIVEQTNKVTEHTFPKEYKGKWIVNIKGGPNQNSFEISVVRKDNSHGIKSYGWFDDNKILISSSGGPCRNSVPEIVWSKLVRTARETAKQLNWLEEHDGQFKGI